MKAASQGVSLNRYIAEILDRETAEKKDESQKQRSSKRLVGYGTFHFRRAKTKAASKAPAKKVNFPSSGEMIKRKSQ